MKILELKEKLIKQINNIEDESLLVEISELLDFEKDESDIYYFTDEQKRAIEKAQEGYARGEYLSNDEADKQVEEWFKNNFEIK
jgi:hypothetical protein